MYYIVYDSTGNILRHGICQSETLLLQATAGEQVMPGVADDRRQKVDVSASEHRIVDLTAEEIAARAMPMLSAESLDAVAEAASADSEITTLQASLDAALARIAALEAKQTKG